MPPRRCTDFPTQQFETQFPILPPRYPPYRCPKEERPSPCFPAKPSGLPRGNPTTFGCAELSYPTQERAIWFSEARFWPLDALYLASQRQHPRFVAPISPVQLAPPRASCAFPPSPGSSRQERRRRPPAEPQTKRLYRPKASQRSEHPTRCLASCREQAPNCQ